MDKTKAIHDRIKALFPKIPTKFGWQSPKGVVMGRRKYRGKDRYVAGYGHSRIGSHYASGLVYERILGYGETQDDAIAMMERKLKGK